MKKLAFAFSVIALCLLVSCSDTKNEGGMSEKAKKNLENSKAIAKMFEKADFSTAGDHIAADAVDHSGPQGEVKGLDAMKAMFKQFSEMSTDAKNEIVQELADDNYSMMWLKQSWTAKVDDPMMGMKAGEKGNMESIEVCKHNADGKIAEHWSFMSMTDAMKMMPQQQMPTTDTTKAK